MAENGHKVSTGWPSWRYGEVAGEVVGRVFERANDVPNGWADNPDKLRKAEKTSVLINKPTKLGSDA